MLKKKKIRLRTKRALLIRGARLRKIRKLRALRAKRVLHKRPLKGRSAWLKKRNVRYGGTGVQSPYNQSSRLPLPIRTRTVRTARDTTRRTTRDSTRVSPWDSRTDISWLTKHSNRVDRIIPVWNDTCITVSPGDRSLRAICIAAKADMPVQADVEGMRQFCALQDTRP